MSIKRIRWMVFFMDIFIFVFILCINDIMDDDLESSGEDMCRWCDVVNNRIRR